MDNGECEAERPKVDTGRLEDLAQSIRRRLGLDLIGIDVIVDSETGRQGVIDINAFPGMTMLFSPWLFDFQWDVVWSVIFMLKLWILQTSRTTLNVLL